MNALVASVIRTIVPIVIGHVAAWLLLINIVLPDAMRSNLELGLGGFLSIVYYIAVRVLEQQWPRLGALLGLSVSPDSYSKGNVLSAIVSSLLPVPTGNTPAVAEATLSQDAAPATVFPKAATELAVAAEPAPAPAGLDAPIAPATTPTV